MKNWLGFLTATAAAFLLAIMATTPPGPVPASADAKSFSAERAMVDVRRIASVPHPAGSAEDAAVRAYLVEHLRAMGLEVRETTSPMPQKSIDRMTQWSKGTLVPTTLINVIGVLPGKDRALPAVAMMAHHDTVWGSPGAADDTAGVASILEAVRAIKAQGQPLRDLAVIITDGEETGLSGAKAFFAEDPLRQHIGAVVNMEARGGGGRTTLFQTSRNNGDAVRLYAKVVSHPGGSSLAAYIYSVLPNDTDLSVMLKAGDTLGYNFAFIGRPGLYHSPKATPDRLDEGALQDMGGQVLAITSALASAQQLPAPSADVVFFDVFGLFTVVYSVWVGWLMIGATAAGLGLAAKRGCTVKDMLVGLGRMLALIVGAGLALYLLNIVSGSGEGHNYYDRLAAIPMLELMAAFTCMATFLLVYGKSAWSNGQLIGGTLLLALLGTAAQVFAPTAAYFILWPVLLAMLAIWAAAKYRWISAICAGLTFGYMLYLGHFIMQGVGPVMPSVAALTLALATAAMLPLWPGIAKRTNRNAVIALSVLAVGMALWIRLDPIADTVAVYSTDHGQPPIPITKG